MAFDFTALLRDDLAPPAEPWSGFPRYNFVGGHNDGPSVPTALLAAMASEAILSEGADLATYKMQSGPLGYRPLREGIAAALQRRAGMPTDPDEVLITSGKALRNSPRSVIASSACRCEAATSPADDRHGQQGLPGARCNAG